MDERLCVVYDWIETYKTKTGYSPSHQEIADGLNISTAQVFQAMELMESQGMIVRPRGLLKAIKLLSRQPVG